MKRKVVVRAIITDKDKKEVLLGKRVSGFGAGQWSLIGGKPEEGESNKETVIREVEEEIGVKFDPIYWGEEVDKRSVESQEWDVFYYEGTIEGQPKIKEDEISEVKYFSFDEIKTSDLAFDHNGILMKYFLGEKLNK